MGGDTKEDAVPNPIASVVEVKDVSTSSITIIPMEDSVVAVVPNTNDTITMTDIEMCDKNKHDDILERIIPDMSQMSPIQGHDLAAGASICGTPLGTPVHTPILTPIKFFSTPVGTPVKMSQSSPSKIPLVALPPSFALPVDARVSMALPVAAPASSKSLFTPVKPATQDQTTFVKGLVELTPSNIFPVGQKRERKTTNKPPAVVETQVVEKKAGGKKRKHA